MSAFRTAVFFGIVGGIESKASFSADDVQIFFEKDHRRAAEVRKGGNEDRFAVGCDCRKSGTGNQFFNLEARD